MMLHRAVEAVHRQEGGRILAGLIGRFRDFDAAEDALQDAFSKALKEWPVGGLPANPAAWLTTVAQRLLIDRLRRERRTHPQSADLLEKMAGNLPEDPELIEDDQLRLIFTCCHPALAPSAQAALALRTLCQLSTAEIARAFVEPETTTAQKIVRAKRKIAAAGIPYKVPDPEDLPERLASVLAVIYLVFNEGYSATRHEGLLRPNLCTEAIRLGRLLVQLMPDEPEAKGLLAMMLLHDARREAREAADGSLIPMEEQNREAWNATQIDEGTRVLDAALNSRKPGPYQIQAAIAALHCTAKQPADTDWVQISALYGALQRHNDTPVIRLNAAVAIAMVAGPEAGLTRLQQLQDEGDLDSYYLFHATRADFLRRLGRFSEAAKAYEKTLAFTSNSAERHFLQLRLQEVSELPG